MSDVGALGATGSARDALDPSAVSYRQHGMRAILGLALRLVRGGTSIVAGVVAGLSAFVVVQFRSTFAESMDTGSLTALAANPAIRTLFGTPAALDDPGGFTVWRTGTPVAVLVSTWALLATTRITRGEEDAGRWALLLAGRFRLPLVVAGHLGVMLGAQVVVGSALAVGLLLARTEATGALLYAAAITLVGMTFAGVGALAAQLVADRRLAAGAAGAVLGLSLLLRMVADGVERLSWLGWVSPLGLLARVQPYAADRPLPLFLLAGQVVVLAVATVEVARRRDAEAGAWSAPATRAPRLLRFRSLPLFAAHRAVRGLAGWSLGLSAYFALVGALAGSMTEFLARNPRFTELAAQAGVTGLATVDGYAAALLGLLPLPVGIYAAARISADAVDEAERRFSPVFGLPISRTRWALTHASIVTVSALVLVCVAALAMWCGTQAAAVPLDLTHAIAGGLNALPIALVCLGAALLGLGWAPHAVLAIGATPALGGYLLMVLSDTFAWPNWVRAISPFDHTSSVPVTPVDWPGAVGLLLAAAILTVAGVIRYTRRDLIG
jgi:ABC-2 type transport system permease protein